VCKNGSNPTARVDHGFMGISPTLRISYLCARWHHLNGLACYRERLLSNRSQTDQITCHYAPPTSHSVCIIPPRHNTPGTSSSVMHTSCSRREAYARGKVQPLSIHHLGRTHDETYGNNSNRKRIEPRKKIQWEADSFEYMSSNWL